MKVRKALITAAGPNQRSLPLQTLIDADGIQKSVLSILVGETLSAGVEEVCVVIWPGDGPSYLKAAGDSGSRLRLVEQAEPRGYGNAIYCCRDFVAGEPFLHLVGDHLYCSQINASCAQQLIEVAERESCSVSAVQATREGNLPYYGVIGGRRVTGMERLYQVQKVIEKPTPTEAEQELIIPGLRAGHYLRFFGMHVISPVVMQFLEGNQPLSPALAKLADRERYLALEVQGLSYDMGLKYGLLTAQLALALLGKDREEILSLIIELLASRKQSAQRS